METLNGKQASMLCVENEIFDSKEGVLIVKSKYKIYIFSNYRVVNKELVNVMCKEIN